jgi:glycosyltransferase involved in cell wall biosynthesis
MNRLKILFLTHHRRFKIFLRSGAMAKELAKRGHEITLICVSGHARFARKENFVDGVRYVETPDLLPGALRSGWDLWNAFHRWLYLANKSYDLIHSFETRPATIYPLLRHLRRHPTPLVIDWNDWWGRGGLISELRPRWYQYLFGGVETYFEENFRKLAHGTTVISRALAERAKNLGVQESSIFWIPGGASVDHFYPVDRFLHREAYALPRDHFILGFSALDVTFDAEILLQALKRVTVAHPKTLLITTGRYSRPLDNRAAALGIKNHFWQLGLLPYASLPEALSCADVFVLPFRDKIANVGRWPNKICDYMSLGRPTVSNGVGELKTLFQRRRIGLIAGETPEDMAAKILELLHDPALQEELGATARKVAIEEFSWPVIVDRLETCYSAALKGAFNEQNRGN